MDVEVDNGWLKTNINCYNCYGKFESKIFVMLEHFNFFKHIKDYKKI